MVKVPAEFCERLFTFLSEMGARYMAERGVQSCNSQTDRATDAGGIFYIVDPKLPCTSDQEELRLPGYIVVLSAESQPTFRRNMWLANCFHAGFFDIEDGNDMFLRNEG
jgi:hypothetical protein